MQHFGNDLIMHHLAKRQSNETFKKYHSHGRSLKRKNKILGDEGLFVVKRTSKESEMC